MIDETLEFKVFEVSEFTGNAAPTFSGHIVQRTVRDLPLGNVLVRVSWSSLNYKDALSASGNRGVTRTYPHIPGIDASGIVAYSEDSAFQPGDHVLVTGYDLGMNTSGGFSQYIRIPSRWLVRLPETLSLRHSMVLGTAGLTAALCIEKLLKNGVRPEQGDVLVTGATGGVGSIAVALLSHLGFCVTACTGKPQQAGYLSLLGARAIVSRAELVDSGTRPLLKERWAAAVDVAGGDLLWSILRSLHYGGSVAVCGLVGSPALQASVFPFILRHVNLLGVDSVNMNYEQRCSLWQKLASEWRIPQLDSISKTINFNQLDYELKLMLEGGAVGRRVLDVNA